MGAIVTIKVRPGTQIEGLREKISKVLTEATGQQVTVTVNAVTKAGYNTGVPKTIPSKYAFNNE